MADSRIIADLERRLAELDRERLDILAALEQLKKRDRGGRAAYDTAPNSGHTTGNSAVFSNSEKITLFRSLFRGREDVFPRRWENPKTGKSGYAPACHNEWVRAICEKPRIKCSNCPNQAFVPVSETMVRSHLQGRERKLRSNQVATAGWNSEGGLIMYGNRAAQLAGKRPKVRNEARGLIMDKFVEIWDQLTLNQRPRPVDRDG